MKTLGKAVLIAGGMATVGALSYIYGLVTVITDLDKSSETAYNIYRYDVEHRPINSIQDLAMRLNVEANKAVKDMLY